MGAAAALDAENAAVAMPFDMHNVGIWRGCRKPVFTRPEAAGAEQSGTTTCALVQDALHPLAPASSTPAATIGTEATADAALRASSTGGVSGIRTDQQAPQCPLQAEFFCENSHVSSDESQLQQLQQPHEPAVHMPSATRGRVMPGQGLRSPSTSTIGVDSGVVGSGAVFRTTSQQPASADFSAVPE